MWISPSQIICLLFCIINALVHTDAYSPVIERIIKAAREDGINLTALSFAPAAFASIEEILIPVTANASKLSNATTVDSHGHVLPDWYRALVPSTSGRPQPLWNIQSHFEFMSRYGIGHEVVTISTPGSAAFPGNEVLSVGLARLMNEWLSALVRTYPRSFSFYATTPLPYVAAAIKEVDYARSHLGAIGTGAFSNHEGKYLGNSEFIPFFAHLESRQTPFEVIFIHSSSPLLNMNGTFMSANPTIYPDGYAEFFFETARTVMDLTTSLTIQNFTKIRYHIPSAGGSFPSIEDRILKSYYPALEASSKAAYIKRFWWDSAGPVFSHQVQGLLAYSIPPSNLLFGTDWPYRPAFEYPGDLEAIADAGFITAADKKGIFRSNAEVLYGLNF